MQKRRNSSFFSVDRITLISMPRVNMSIGHELPSAEALKRIKRLLAHTKKQYGEHISDLKESWKGSTGEFSFRVMGFLVEGTLDVRNREVVLDGKVPWAAMPFKGKIETMIREEAEELLT